MPLCNGADIGCVSYTDNITGRESGKDTGAAKTNVTVEKKSNRAGATPLFRLSAAQKVRGVAPALRHR